MRETNTTIILGICGSIAACKAADLARRLMDQRHNVIPVMTKGARKFVTPKTFSVLTGNNVHKGFWDGPDEMPHINLARTADAVLIAPATANFISKAVCGLADDLLSCLLLTTRAPILMAPAMNTDMYLHPVIQEHLKVLKARGVTFIDPVEGSLACETTGIGHLAEIPAILDAVDRCLKKA